MIAVIIPCYKEKKHIAAVLGGIPEVVTRIIVVDDACPEGTGQWVSEMNLARVTVVRHKINLGVGAAMVTGYREILKDPSIQIVVKMDGDGQMDPAFISSLTRPIQKQSADYTKGNRFFEIGFLKGMPARRLLGNTVLSFISKVSTGYWNLMDPTNGFTAIQVKCLRVLPIEKLARGYFFETDILFRLNTLRAKIEEVPMRSQYGDETSKMNLTWIFISFPYFHLNRFLKRIFYNYYLRDFNVASCLFVTGISLILSGTSFGAYHWSRSSIEGILSSSGTVMLAALPVMIGFQCLLASIVLDVMSVPSKAVHPSLD